MSLLSQFFPSGGSEGSLNLSDGLAKDYSKQIPVDLMVIGGGGGGGGVSGTPMVPQTCFTMDCLSLTGAGGAGRALTFTGALVNKGVAYPITVGAGGATNSAGGTSCFGTLIAGGGANGSGVDPAGNIVCSCSSSCTWGGNIGGDAFLESTIIPGAESIPSIPQFYICRDGCSRGSINISKTEVTGGLIPSCVYTCISPVNIIPDHFAQNWSNYLQGPQGPGEAATFCCCIKQINCIKCISGVVSSDDVSSVFSKWNLPAYIDTSQNNQRGGGTTYCTTYNPLGCPAPFSPLGSPCPFTYNVSAIDNICICYYAPGGPSCPPSQTPINCNRLSIYSYCICQAMITPANGRGTCYDVNKFQCRWTDIMHGENSMMATAMTPLFNPTCPGTTTCTPYTSVPLGCSPLNKYSCNPRTISQVSAIGCTSPVLVCCYAHRMATPVGPCLLPAGCIFECWKANYFCERYGYPIVRTPSPSTPISPWGTPCVVTPIDFKNTNKELLITSTCIDGISGTGQGGVNGLKVNPITPIEKVLVHRICMCAFCQSPSCPLGQPACCYPQYAACCNICFPYSLSVPGYSQSGGAGGSGSVWVIYPSEYAAATVTGNTPVASPPAVRVYRWDGAGTITFN